MKVLSLPTHAHPRIVALLEELLDKAKAGDVTGLFVYTEDADGNVTHWRDGMADHSVIFNLELVKKRILGEYR